MKSDSFFVSDTKADLFCEEAHEEFKPYNFTEAITEQFTASLAGGTSILQEAIPAGEIAYPVNALSGKLYEGCCFYSIQQHKKDNQFSSPLYMNIAEARSKTLQPKIASKPAEIINKSYDFVWNTEQLTSIALVKGMKPNTETREAYDYGGTADIAKMSETEFNGYIKSIKAYAEKYAIPPLYSPADEYYRSVMSPAAQSLKQNDFDAYKKEIEKHIEHKLSGEIPLNNYSAQKEPENKYRQSGISHPDAPSSKEFPHISRFYGLKLDTPGQLNVKELPALQETSYKKYPAIEKTVLKLAEYAQACYSHTSYESWNPSKEDVKQLKNELNKASQTLVKVMDYAYSTAVQKRDKNLSHIQENIIQENRGRGK